MTIKCSKYSTNVIYFKALSDFNHFQIDLAANMEVMLVEFEGVQLDFSREFDAVYVYFNREIKKGENTMTGSVAIFLWATIGMLIVANFF